MFVDVRDQVTGKLLFRYDPERELIEVAKSGVKILVDLTVYQQQPQSAAERPNSR